MKMETNESKLPDPSGPPEPLEEKEEQPLATSFKKVFGGLFAVVVGGGIVLPVLLSSTVTCRGATRSTRLILVEREQQIQQAIAQADVAPAAGESVMNADEGAVVDERFEKPKGSDEKGD